MPTADSMASSSWPERPTKGWPWRSSCSPGASPTTSQRAGWPPWPKTAWRRPWHRPQAVQDTTCSRSSSRSGVARALGHGNERGLGDFRLLPGDRRAAGRCARPGRRAPARPAGAACACGAAATAARPARPGPNVRPEPDGRTLPFKSTTCASTWRAAGAGLSHNFSMPISRSQMRCNGFTRGAAAPAGGMAGMMSSGDRTAFMLRLRSRRNAFA